MESAGYFDPEICQWRYLDTEVNKNLHGVFYDGGVGYIERLIMRAALISGVRGEGGCREISRKSPGITGDDRTPKVICHNGKIKS